MNITFVIDFINTLDLRPYQEGLDSPVALAAWLVERELLPPGSTVTSRDLREARQSRRRPSAASGFARAEPESAGVRGALGQLLSEVAVAQADGTWSELKACRADDCLWIFQDTTKNHSRAWCKMSSCGNREKARSYRERHLGH